MISREAGFTLLELLIATTLLALLSLVMFGGLKFGTRAWDGAERSTEGGNQIRRAQDAIAGALSRAYPEMQQGSLASAHVYFDGDSNSVTFLAPDQLDDGGLAVYTLAHSGEALVLTSVSELAEDPSRQMVSHKLLDDVAALDIAYFGQANANDTPHWSSIWKGASRLPLLVRIRADLTKRGPKWTELIVNPRIAADVGCTYDALSKFCQGR